MKAATKDYRSPETRIAEALRQFNISKPVIEGLFDFINHIPKYESFAVIAGNLRQILKSLKSVLIEDKIADPKLSSNLDAWINCCGTISIHQQDIELLLPGFCMGGYTPFQPPFRDFFESHTLAVALWCSTQNEDLHRKYAHLQAHLCLAFHTLRTQSARKKKLTEDSRIRACRAVRKLSRPDYAESLEKFPDQPLSMKMFRRFLGQFEDDKDLHPLLTLIDFALKEKTARERTANPVRRIMRGRFDTEQQDVSFGEGADDGERMNILKVNTGNRTQVAARKKTLCSPGEFNSSRQFATQEREGRDPSGGLSGRQQHFMAKGVASALAMHNQRLPHDWERLTAFEIEVFLKELGELSTGSGNVMGIQSNKLAAFLAICFWRSTPPEVAHRATLVPEPASCKTALGIKWSSNNKEGWWVVKPRVAKLVSVPSNVVTAQAVPLVSGFYTLTIPKPAAESMDRHLSSIPVTYQPRKIFTHKLEEYVKAADGVLKNLRARTGGRHSLQRIAMHLHHHIAQQPGSDITAAMAITGRNDPLGAVPLHYTGNSIERLKRIYAEACTSIHTDAGLGIEPETPQKESEYNVGSRYVPKPETVRNLVDDLRERLRLARDNAGNDPIELHNMITVYTVAMLGFATGYRAVHDPLLQEAEIDRESGFAVISDKDDDSFYNARIIWLPDICLRQFALYQNHLFALQRWLFDHNLPLFFKSREKASTGRQTDRENPALFFLESNADDLPVQPKLLKKLLAETSYQLPINANRHYLRTNLMNMGCPQEVVSAFLGHWERGEEPWGRYSGLSPIVYRKELAKHLVKLIGNDGWKLETGFAG